MPDAEEILQIHRQSQAICESYQLTVEKVDKLEEHAAGGFTVSIWIPEHLRETLSWDGPELKEVRSRLETIEGVARFWQWLAPNPT